MDRETQNDIKEVQEKIDNISGNEYFNACVKCGSTSDLCQYAHRNVEGRITGWLFSCPDCKDGISGLEMNEVFGYPKPKKPRLLSDEEIRLAISGAMDDFDAEGNPITKEYEGVITDYDRAIAQAQLDICVNEG